MPEDRITCPRCGVEQSPGETCIACGYVFKEGDAKKPSIAPAPAQTPAPVAPTDRSKAAKSGADATLKRKKKKKEAVHRTAGAARSAGSRKKSGKSLLIRVKTSTGVRLVGIAGVRSVWFSPAGKFILLCIAAVLIAASLIWSSYRSVIEEIGLNTIIDNTAYLAPDTPAEEVDAQAADLIKNRVVATLAGRGHQINPQLIIAEPVELSAALRSRLADKGSLEQWRAVKVHGAFSFTFLGVAWLKRSFDVEGAYNLEGYAARMAELRSKELERQRRIMDYAQQRLLAVPAELPATVTTPMEEAPAPAQP